MNTLIKHQNYQVSHYDEVMMEPLKQNKMNHRQKHCHNCGFDCFAVKQKPDMMVVSYLLSQLSCPDWSSMNFCSVVGHSKLRQHNWSVEGEDNPKHNFQFSLLIYHHLESGELRDID